MPRSGIGLNELLDRRACALQSWILVLFRTAAAFAVVHAGAGQMLYAFCMGLCLGAAALREKSLRLTGYLEQLIDAALADVLQVVTPRDPVQRGAQLSLRVREGRDAGRALFGFLQARGVAAIYGPGTTVLFFILFFLCVMLFF